MASTLCALFSRAAEKVAQPHELFRKGRLRESQPLATDWAEPPPTKFYELRDNLRTRVHRGCLVAVRL